MLNKEDILSLLKVKLNLHPLRVKNIYLFGSRCYGNSNEYSDYDLVVIANSSVENVEYNLGEYNIHIQTVDYFQSRLDWNDIKALECVMWSDKIMETVEFKYDIVPKKLRHAISHISSNSWVKADKKINNGDIYIGQKSLFHSIRILMYGIQISEHGEIIDWGCCNKYWNNIISTNDWLGLKEIYQPIKNQLKSEFKLKCPYIK